MSSKDKNIIGGGESFNYKPSQQYGSHIWLCKCSRCNMNFYNKSARVVCDSCLTIDKREEKLEEILNNNKKS
jgi:hypothetical protein